MESNDQTNLPTLPPATANYQTNLPRTAGKITKRTYRTLPRRSYGKLPSEPRSILTSYGINHLRRLHSPSAALAAGALSGATVMGGLS